MTIGPSGSRKALNTLECLRGQIVSGNWPVGNAIPKEPELAELAGVGRSTVREAVRSLASLGMVETVKGMGTFVRSRSPIPGVLAGYLSDFSATDVISLRAALCVEAASIAASRADAAAVGHLRQILSEWQAPDPTNERSLPEDPFRRAIFDIASSPLLYSMMRAVVQAMRGLAADNRLVRVLPGKDVLAQHRAILDAIEHGDSREAEIGMRAEVADDLRATSSDQAPLSGE